MVNAAIALTQLCALAGYIGCVVKLNHVAPRHTSPRSLKLTWLIATVVACIMLTWLSGRVLNLPSRLASTPLALQQAHERIRAQCMEQVKSQQFHLASATIRQRTKSAELVAEAKLWKEQHAAAKQGSLSALLAPILNSLLFHTGVAIAAAPALVRLMMLAIRVWMRNGSGGGSGSADSSTQRSPADQRFADRTRREYGVLLPVINAVTLFSACVSPTFYFFIEPGRASRCIYSSGHWYTLTCTLMTFACVITHLYRNRFYSRAAHQLLVWYVGFAACYLAMGLSVLKETQTFFHDDVEAVDGMMQAAPAFMAFIAIFAVFQFVTADKRGVAVGASGEHTKRVKRVDEDVEETEEGDDTDTGVGGVSLLDAMSDDSDDDALAGVAFSKAAQRQLKRESEAAAAASRRKAELLQPSPSPSPQTERKASESKQRDANAAATEPEPIPSAPEAPPMAPPMAPPSPPSAPAVPSIRPTAAAKSKTTSASKPKSEASAPTLADLTPNDFLAGRSRLRKANTAADTGTGTSTSSSSASSSSSSSLPPKGQAMSMLDALSERLRSVRQRVDGEQDEGDEKEEWD